MALFVGRIPEHVRPRDLEDLFIKYGRIGRCEIKKGGYGFVEFNDVRDAEDALRDGRFQLNGQSIVVEWAKGSGRRSNSDECFRCGRTGHWARDCPSGGRGGSPRSSRYSRYRSRSRDRRRYSRSPSRSYSRSPPRSSRRSSRYRSRSRSYSRPRYHRHERRYYSRSRSVSRGRYDSRSPSPQRSLSRSPPRASESRSNRSISRSPSPRGRSRERSPLPERSQSPPAHTHDQL